MINRKKYNPVQPFSTKGKLLVFFIRFLFHVRKVFGRRDYDEPLIDHHEDPRKMNLKQQIFFAHKYYFKAITQSKNEAIKNYFRSNAISKNDFQIQDSRNEISIGIGGDLMPYESIKTSTCKNLWDEMGDYFFSSDIVCANLETPVNLKKRASFVPEVMLKNMYFNSDEEQFSIFSGNNKYKGYDVLSLANNHSLDQDEEGLINTIRFLQSKNIAFTGVAENKNSLHEFPILEKEGIKIAFLSYTFSLNALTAPEGKKYLVNHLNLNEKNPDIRLIIEQSKLARERGADFIIAFLHMGCAYQPYPSEQIIQNYKLIAESTGIDVLSGGHPHNAMPLSSLKIKDPFTGHEKKSLFIFSLGDFVAYDIFKWCHLPLIIKLRISKNKGITFISGIEAKLIYTYAEIKNREIQSIRFLDYMKVKNDVSILSNNSRAEKEFFELRQFAEEFLLPGNLELFIK